METYFITGIGTEVGKTIASAIVTEALEADYWKPIQAGDLDHSDTHKVKEMVSNQKTIFHPNSFALETPMSPHAAAEIDGVEISSENIMEPKTENDLVIEGAGGLLVPINDTQTIADIIKPHHKVILVSRYYLGSINHTLLTAEALKSRGLNCIGIIFNGEKTPSSEEIILKMTGLPTLLHIDQEESFDRETVKRYAKQLREALKTES
ncbi:dethiobiotin synthase [Salinimicrobium catena]|uniref:dethiobiotin synthase n=1 Tax=Salinimicrobium catena TaxID=390640 RepID=UPI002FE4BFC7